METYRYLPYGERYAGTHTIHQYTGKERDSESGLDYFGARYLSSAHGRWMSVDPIVSMSDPQSLNRYASVAGNPINFLDPDGRGVQCVSVVVNGVLVSFKCHVEAPKPDPAAYYNAWSVYVATFSWGNNYNTLGAPPPITSGPPSGMMSAAAVFSQEVAGAKSLLSTALSPDNITSDCESFFETLGISPQSFLDKLAHASVRDASTMNSPFTAISGDPAFQHWIGLWLDKNAPPKFPLFWKRDRDITVQRWFEKHGDITALSFYYANTILIRNVDYVIPGRIAHETLHLFPSLTDDGGIQSKLGLTNGPSENITHTFEAKCLSN